MKTKANEQLAIMLARYRKFAFERKKNTKK